MIRRVKVILFWTFYLALSSCCSSQNIPTSKGFNKEAAEYFERHYGEFDLATLDAVERCMLQKAVENDLDELSEPAMRILHDKFVIKHYFEDFLQLHFSFVKNINSSQFYFIILPELDEYIYQVEQNYVQLNDTTYQLKWPREPVRINTYAIERLLSAKEFELNNDLAVEKDVRSLVYQILNETFDFLGPNEISNATLENQLRSDLASGSISQASFDSVMKFVDASLRNEIHLKIVSFQKVGYILEVFGREVGGQRLTLDILFLPDNQRAYLSRTHVINHRECLQAR